MYRVFDTKEKCWVNDNVFLSKDEKLYLIKKKMFGKEKLKLASKKRYVPHSYIWLNDKYDNPIYEGDIVKAEISDNEFLVMQVAYSPEVAAYVLLNYETNKYYSLGKKQCKHLEVVGNIFDNKDMIKHESEKSESKSKSESESENNQSLS